ncbi:hypothetical protein GCM10007100_34610 [Roseibacillus persicicus]|uniref:DUF4132 domain-containing protein n=2 Tax=Roseibacillus persicicus TaxID=454148 RepID=A0A918TV89_9BACT|nr:hypothetical protein GCM10007100_34610 [Roseibacillus persicicus]
MLITLDHLRHGQFHDDAVKLITKASQTELPTPFQIIYLADTNPQKCVELTGGLLKSLQNYREVPNYIVTKAFQAIANQWTKGGREVLFAIAKNSILPTSFTNDGQAPSIFSHAFAEMCLSSAQVPGDDLAELVDSATDTLSRQSLEKRAKNELLNSIWAQSARLPNPSLESHYWSNLTSNLKTLQQLAIESLVGLKQADTSQKAIKLLQAKKADARLGAAALLETLAEKECIPDLQNALESETSDKVKTALFSALAACGVEEDSAQPELPLPEILKSAAKLKLPKTSFLNLGALPPLLTQDGSALPEVGLTFLIAKQAKHKPVEPSPEILPLLSHLDLEKSGPFALALYQQWFASEQAAKDRWALTLAGLLGGQKIVPELIAPINDWALNSRHKLAEYAAQAISLVPGDEALTILDSLANRYRSKFKNIGKACRAALEAAAENRGVSLDELADLIVPTLGFDEEGQRPLEDSQIEAVLQPDFKLNFYNPDTEKETKSPPSTLSDTAKEDLKTLRKLIRETIKGQTARLEGCLVRQRRWDTARWQELFENHPLLQTYASNLVWATYDSASSLQRTFRRYPNGLLANAGGDLIEFEKDEVHIGMVHPLELSAEDLLAWQQHLERMKVKPPFAQLDRPVALLDSNHKNRKELKTADKKSLSCGTFRSRAEKRGWQRGSVVDAGGIWYYYKSYQGAGVDVFLHVEEMYVGQDPMEEITLGTAMFVQGDSVHIGSYEYNEPNNTDDPRVLAFGKVPPIVYSETVTDLEAITS